MNKLIMMVWGLIERRVLGVPRLRLGLRLWLDFATYKLCLGRSWFDRRVNFITDYMRFPGSAENLDFYLFNWSTMHTYLGIKSLLNGMLKNVNNFINTKCWFLFLHSLSFNWSTMHTYSSLLNGMLKSANNFIQAALKSKKWAKTKRFKNCGTPCSLN